MAAENRLHDLGVIPITSSDAQGMGRAGETWWRTFALAAVMADADESTDDNDRLLRYLAKITINPAVAHGISHEIGRLAPGFLADIVLWQPTEFAAKPHLVLKSGYPTWGATGDPNASIDSAEPRQLAEQFGAHGVSPADLSLLFSNAAALAEGTAPTTRRAVAVRDCRTVRSTDLIRHGVLGEIEVPGSAGAPVRWQGENLTMEPVTHTPLSRLHFW
jgi:urease subunit alpha